MLIKRFSTLKAFIKTPHRRVELAGKAGPRKPCCSTEALRMWTAMAHALPSKMGLNWGRRDQHGQGAVKSSTDICANLDILSAAQ